MENEKLKKKKKMRLSPLGSEIVEVDPICSIESDFIRMKLKENACDDGRRLGVAIPVHTLVMVVSYCEKRAKIKLQHLSHDDDDENLTDEQKNKLKKIDSIFLQYIYRHTDYNLAFQILDAAVKLRVKSLYDLILDDVVRFCDQLTPRQVSRIIRKSRLYWERDEDYSSYNWAFIINGTHKASDGSDTIKPGSTWFVVSY